MTIAVPTPTAPGKPVFSKLRILQMRKKALIKANHMIRRPNEEDLVMATRYEQCEEMVAILAAIRAETAACSAFTEGLYKATLEELNEHLVKFGEPTEDSITQAKKALRLVSR